MNTIIRYVPTSNGDGPQKGTIENPYTEEEMKVMLDDGTWQGGFVGSEYATNCATIRILI